jgi:hypothetical protein
MLNVIHLLVDIENCHATPARQERFHHRAAKTLGASRDDDLLVV